MTTERNTAATGEHSHLSQDRELRDDELDAATGGIVMISTIGILVGLLLPQLTLAVPSYPNQNQMAKLLRQAPAPGRRRKLSPFGGARLPQGAESQRANA